MQKIALITDSTCDITKDLIEKNNIHVIPFRIIYSNREYRDGVDISAEEVYSNLENEVPTTSLPSLLDMENLFDKLEGEGYTHAIAVTVSAGLSGMFNALRLVSLERENIKCHVFDSKSISLAEGGIVLKCAQMLEENKSFEEIIEALPKLRDRMECYMVMATLKYLKKGGRIGKISGTIAEALNLKPVIRVNEEGVYDTHDKVRGRKQSIKRLIEIVSKFEKPGEVYVVHGGAEDEMNFLADQLAALPNVKSVLRGGNTTPVCGVHSGPGLLGFAYLAEE